jgi:hypothetical protein
MKTTAELGIKISARTREFYRYTGVSADLERRGAGSSQPELAWALTSQNPGATPGARQLPNDQSRSPQPQPNH